MSKTSDRINLTNQFLIAMPGMADGTFAGTVVYLCEHTEKGALGLVINKPIDIDLRNLFEKVELTLDREPLVELPVYFGGPVQTERGFVLHEPPARDGEPYNSSLSDPRRPRDDDQQGRAGGGLERRRPEAACWSRSATAAGAPASSKKKSGKQRLAQRRRRARASSSTRRSSSATKRRCRCWASIALMLSGEAGHA